MRFTQAHFSCLSRSLWTTSRPSGMSTTPHSLASSLSSANLLRLHLIPPSMSLMKTLNSSGPNMDAWGTPVIIDLHPDIEPLTTACWMWPFRQFHLHLTVHPSYSHLSNLERRMLMIFKVPSNPYHSMILWFYDLPFSRYLKSLKLSVYTRSNFIAN